MRRSAGAHPGHRRLVWVVAGLLLAASGAALSPSVAMPAPARTMQQPAGLLPAQGKGRVEDLAAGKILVARRNVPDPYFAEAVIFLAYHDEEGALGLILNRPTKIPLSRALRGLKSAGSRKDPVYLGGPVARSGMLALLRSPTKPEEARHVIEDIYLVASLKTLQGVLAKGTGSSAFRLYMGYCGWGAGQLEREVALGVWHIFSADASAVFDPHPASLWDRLIRRTELRIVSVPPLPASQLRAALLHGLWGLLMRSPAVAPHRREQRQNQYRHAQQAIDRLEGKHK